MAVGITVGILAVLVAAAGWRLGATNRGLVFLAVAAGLGIGGRIAGVEEYVLFAVALGVLLAAGPIVLWHRADRAVTALQIELRPSSHEVQVGGEGWLSVSVFNTGQRTCAPMRLERPDDAFALSRPGFRRAPADDAASSSARSRRSRGWRKRISRGIRVPALGAEERAELLFPIPSQRRGVLTVPSLRLWCLDPFELFAYEMVVTTEASIVVVPDPTPPRSLVGGVLQPAGRFVWAPPQSGESSGGQGFDLSGLRPYVAGDRLRLLHWPTLARTGDLLVRDFEGSGTDAVTLIMDDRADKIDPDSFESVISATAGVGVEAARLGLGVELRSPGGVHLDLQAEPMLSKALLRVLATLDPVRSRPGRGPVGTYGLHKVATGDGSDEDRHRVVVTTASALDSLPELLRRSSTVVVV
ncbi:MAG: DUF58 domain-containing protein [Acidimicrobiales bacterium]